MPAQILVQIHASTPACAGHSKSVRRANAKTYDLSPPHTRGKPSGAVPEIMPTVLQPPRTRGVNSGKNHTDSDIASTPLVAGRYSPP